MTTTTTSTPLSTVIGVFSDYKQANKAIDELRRADFRYERIRLVERGTGRFTDTLKGMFSGQTAVASSTSDNLVNMGMPEYEAQYYQRELDAEHVLLLMNADDRPEDAFKVMRQNGAFDINSRLRTTDMNGANEVSEPATFQKTVSPATTPPTNLARKDVPTDVNAARSGEAAAPAVPADVVSNEVPVDSVAPTTVAVDPGAPVMTAADPNAPAVAPDAPDDMTDSEAFTNTDAVDANSQRKAARNS